MSERLSEEELAVVTLVAEGLTRWAIAQRLDLSENSVRNTIRRLCARFGCTMRDLPDRAGVASPADFDDDFSFLPREA